MAPDRRWMSLLDKLVDAPPEPDLPLSFGTHWSTPTATDRLMQIIIRDVTSLLNTKRRFLSIPERCPELRTSLLDYGLPDFSGGDFVPKASWTGLREAIEESIRKYEHRLQNVQVELVEPEHPGEHRLCFQISAELVSNRELVAFEVGLTPPSAQFQSLEEEG